jgi:hypothetical protein
VFFLVFRLVFVERHAAPAAGAAEPEPQLQLSLPG